MLKNHIDIRATQSDFSVQALAGVSFFMWSKFVKEPYVCITTEGFIFATGIHKFDEVQWVVSYISIPLRFFRTPDDEDKVETLLKEVVHKNDLSSVSWAPSIRYPVPEALTPYVLSIIPHTLRPDPEGDDRPDRELPATAKWFGWDYVFSCDAFPWTAATSSGAEHVWETPEMLIRDGLGSLWHLVNKNPGVFGSRNGIGPIGVPTGYIPQPIKVDAGYLGMSKEEFDLSMRKAQAEHEMAKLTVDDITKARDRLMD